MSPVLVVGAGISGIACARALWAAGIDVRVLDRGRRVGGRMASRNRNGRPVDVGASYFTVSDPTFEAVVDDWERRGVARRWTDTFVVHGEGPKLGPLRWASPGGLRSLVEDLAEGLAVEPETTVAAVTSTPDGWSVDGGAASAVVLAMPDPQAHRLLDDGLLATLPAAQAYEPVLALTAIFAERTWDFDGLFVSEDPVLGWIADDGRRRGDDGPVLVAHSTPGFASDHLREPAAAEEAMTAALLRVLGVPAAPIDAYVHRWTFARPVGSRDEPYSLSDAGLGLCGDGWSGKPRVEGAYLSGRALGEELAARLG